MRTQITRITAVVATAVLVSFAPMTSASAAVAADRDKRGYAPARFDITRTVANNAEKRVTVKIKVKNLRKAPGTFGFYMVPAGTHDCIYAAQAKRKRDGSVVKRLEQSVGHVAMERMPMDDTDWFTVRSN